jgi:predicted Zn-dependent peptidase
MRVILAFLLTIFYLKGVLMSAELASIKVDGVEVPIVFEHSSNIPTVNLQLTFRDSGSLEDGSLAGLAKVSSILLGEGTKKLGATKFAEKLESKAINLSVGSGIETFLFDVSALKSEFPSSIKLLKELINDPNLDSEILEKVKNRQISRLLSKKSDYDYIANTNLKKLLFAKTPIGRPTTGDVESIKKIEIKDIKDFLASHLNLKRLIVLAGGDISLSDLKKQIIPLLKTLPKGKGFETPFFEASAKEKMDEKDRDTQQAYIYFGSPFYMKPDSEEFYKAKVAAFILGSSGFGSRMMEEIRVKRGLAYSAYMRFNVHKSHSYAFGYLQTKIESQKDAVSVVKEVVENFVENGVTQKELDDAKKFIQGSEPLRNETLSQRLGRAFDEYYKGLPLGYHEKELELISKLKLEELNEFIKNHSEIEKLSFSIVTKK